MAELKILSGNAHPELAQAVANEASVGLVEAAIDKFPDGETRVRIVDNIREYDVFLIQPTGPPVNENIMEAFVIMDALRRASAAKVIAVTPYFGYARQDKKDESRTPITAKLVSDLFVAAGANRLLAFNLHAAQIQGFTNLPHDHLDAGRTISDTLVQEIDNPVFVAPDVGASKLARDYAKRLNTDWAIVDKDRIDGNTTKVAAVIGKKKVKNRNVVIVDDVISTAGTILSAADTLKDRGALEIFAAVTHGVLCGDTVERIESSRSLDRLYTTDTLPEVNGSDKIRRISIARLLAKAIINIHDGRSISRLFESP